MTDYKNKRLLQQNLHIIIQNMQSEYDAYFVTFTFKNTHNKIPYDCLREYFRFFYRKLNQFTLSSSKVQYTKSSLILIPEQSYQCIQANMHSTAHFHGFLMIHHKNRDRFYRRCLIEDSEAKKIYFHPALRNPYPVSIKFDMKIPAIKSHSIDIQKLKNISDIKNTSFYSTKNFNCSDFTDDQIMLFSKLTSEHK